MNKTRLLKNMKRNRLTECFKLAEELDKLHAEVEEYAKSNIVDESETLANLYSAYEEASNNLDKYLKVTGPNFIKSYKEIHTNNI